MAQSTKEMTGGMNQTKDRCYQSHLMLQAMKYVSGTLSSPLPLLRRTREAAYGVKAQLDRPSDKSAQYLQTICTDNMYRVHKTGIVQGIV